VVRAVTFPLDDVQVIDVTTGVAGPYCTKLLRDAGADVIKVEPASGDPLRRYAATTDVPDGEDGALFRYLNAGKRSIVGSLGDGRVDALLPGADLLIEDLPGNLDVGALRARHPHLVVVSITPFGRTGPYAGRPASDLTIQCESGAILFRGPAGRPPVQAGGRIAEFMAGTFAAAPALAAVLRARAGGPGAHIDLSQHEVMAVAGSNYMDLIHQFQGSPEITSALRILDTPAIERAKDGLVAFNTNTGLMFQMFLVLIGRADLMDDPRYASLNERSAMGADWQGLIDGWVGERTVAEILEEASALRVPVAPVHDGATLAHDEQLVARGVFVRGDDDRMLRPRPPYQINGGSVPPGSRAPRLGDHEPEVTPRPPRPSPSDGSLALPLAGVRVVDLTSWWVGALATQALAMLGADVIHVEGASHPDGMRLTGHSIARTPDWWEWGHMFAAANAEKRGIALDLSGEPGRNVLRDLIASADVLVENFSPRVVESWGFGRAEVLALNPDIVYLRMPAFGLTGPWRDRPAFAQIIEPMSTMASVTGFPDGLPVPKGGLPDPVSGMHGAFAALVGLAERRRRGGGVFVESVMIEAAVNVATQTLLEHDAYGHTMKPMGNRSPHAAPQGLYRSLDDDWLAVSVTGDGEWHALVDALDRPAWATDRRLCTLAGRHAHHDELDDALGRWAAERTVVEASDHLIAHGVPAAPCRDPRGIRHHPHLVARGLYEQLDHPVFGKHLLPGCPCRFDGVARWLHTPAPTLGQHNVEVLRDVLGYPDERIAALDRDGVTGTRPVGPAA